MNIEQIKIVDFISRAEDGTVVLTVSDHLDWDAQNEHLLLLQEKLNAYLRFLESGEIYDAYPGAKGAKFLINLVCRFHPTESALDFLERAQSIIESAGFGFSWEPLNGVYIEDTAN